MVPACGSADAGDSGPVRVTGLLLRGCPGDHRYVRAPAPRRTSLRTAAGHRARVGTGRAALPHPVVDPHAGRPRAGPRGRLPPTVSRPGRGSSRAGPSSWGAGSGGSPPLARQLLELYPRPPADRPPSWPPTSPRGRRPPRPWPPAPWCSPSPPRACSPTAGGCRARRPRRPGRRPRPQRLRGRLVHRPAPPRPRHLGAAGPASTAVRDCSRPAAPSGSSTHLSRVWPPSSDGWSTRWRQ